MARVDFVRRSVSREVNTRGVTLDGSDEVRVRAAGETCTKLFPEMAQAVIARGQNGLLSPDGVLSIAVCRFDLNRPGKPRY